MRRRVTWGSWPPVVGDLVIRTLADGEACPPGWTEQVGPPRVAWRVWMVGDIITGDPDTVVALDSRRG